MQTKSKIDIFFNTFQSKRLRNKQTFVDARQIFAKRGIQTATQLLSAYDSLPHDAKFVSLLFFRDCNIRSSARLCFRELRDSELGGIAGAVLASFGGWKIAERLLRRITRKTPASPVVANALSALAHIGGVDDPTPIAMEMIRVCGESDNPWLITLAIEALYNCHAVLNAPPKVKRQIVKCLCECLHHADPEVQGVAAHYLGELRETRCLAKLEELASSAQGEVRGWGPVKRLARNAVRNIRSR